MMHATVTAPMGSQPGQSIPIMTPDGQMLQCTIPAGAAPGQSFQVPIPTVSTGTPVATKNVRVDIRPKYGATDAAASAEYRDRASSCCLTFFGLIVAVLSMFLLSTISYYFNTIIMPCTKCSYYPIRHCWAGTCRYTNDWVGTTPISVDALPYNNASHDSTEPNGDGLPDNWSLIVACVCGSIGGLIAACCIAPGTVDRGSAPAGLLSGGLLLSFALLVASIICLSVQTIANRDQWVYNAFCGEAKGCDEQYQYITDQSLASYWSNDYYYYWFGQTVYWTYSLQIILAFFEMIFIAKTMPSLR